MLRFRLPCPSSTVTSSLSLINCYVRYYSSSSSLSSGSRPPPLFINPLDQQLCGKTNSQQQQYIPKFLAKLREQEEATKTCLKFPSVTSMEDFIEVISNFKKFAAREMSARQEERRRKRMQNIQERSVAMFHRGLKSSPSSNPNKKSKTEDNFSDEFNEQKINERDAFLNSLDLNALAEEISNKVRPGMIKSYLVKNKIWDTKMERLPLIPYQAAKEMVLNSISDPEIRSYFAEYDCKYEEYDTFAQVKHFAVNSSATKSAPHRIPIVTIMGHINHGKTTLLDDLQESNIVETEPGLITQSIRAFTIHVGGLLDGETEKKNIDSSTSESSSSKTTTADLLSSIPRAEDGTGAFLHDAAKVSSIDQEGIISSSTITKKKKKKKKRRFSEMDLANSPFKGLFASSTKKSSEEANTQQQLEAKKPIPQSVLSCEKWKQISQITFIDTPGHRIFAEMRLYGSRLCDIMLLLIALDEGVQGQTEEIVRTALHFNKPVVVAFSKVDLFTDPVMLSRRLSQICNDLQILGLTVRFAADESEEELAKVIDKMRNPHYLLNKAQNKYEATETQKKRNQQEKQRMDNNGVVEETININDENGKQNEKTTITTTTTKKQNSHHQREALAICISASRGINIPLLIRALQRIAGHDSLPRASPASTPAQAVVLESFRDYSSSTTALAQSSSTPGEASSNNNKKREGPVNIVALIRNGTLKIGAPFVCDMGWGVIDRVTNTWGDNLLTASSSACASSNFVLDEDVSNESLLPGAAVVVFGSKDTTCPGPLTHIIEVESPEKAEFISKFRNRQRFFIERHPTLVHLMRPSNKKSEFLHVGNYGQQDPELAFDYNVMVKEAKSPEVKESPLEAQWRANQLKPEEQPKNETEYSELVKNSKVLQVMVKVDGYNSARTAMREIPRLMTKNVVVNVISVGFGPITQQDVEKFGGVDIVVLFRAPRLRDPQAHLVLENRKIKYGEFDVYSEMLEWLKKIILAVQAEESVRRAPQAEADRNVQKSALRAAGFLDEKKGKMRTAQQMTPSLEQRINRKHEDARKDRMFKR